MSNENFEQKKPRPIRLLVLVLLGVGILIVLTPFVVAIYGLISTGSWPQWTGFDKTLWDWMDLLIVPIVLAIGALLFNWSERRSKREIAEARQQEQALQNYLDMMTELLLKEGLLAKKDAEDVPVFEVAQVRTVTTLRILDERRRNILLQFLRDANLIDFLLSEASLSEAILNGAYLSYANLRGTNLSRADLSGANLSEADLSEAFLNGAYLSGANLEWATLYGAYLNGAYLNGAILIGTKVSNEQLSLAATLEGAIMPDGKVYDPAVHILTTPTPPSP